MKAKQIDVLMLSRIKIYQIRFLVSIKILYHSRSVLIGDCKTIHPIKLSVTNTP